MTVEHAKKRLYDAEEGLSYSQRIAIAELLDRLKCCGNCKNFTYTCIKGYEACTGKHLLWEGK